jgi:GNAT superfamily N-acetyltransferase
MITIRKALVSDIPVIVDFQQKLALESEEIKLDADILTRGINAMFEDPRKGSYFLAEQGTEIVGCHMITFEWSDWRNGMVWWLQSVYVKETYRKLGVFRVMYDNLITIIKADQGLIGLRLYVDKTNERAQNVYKAMGMDGDHYTVFEWMKD